MKNLTWSGILVFAAVVIVGIYIVLTTLPPYRLVQPDGSEALRGRHAPRLEANECIRSAVQLLQKVTPITSGKAGGFEISMEFGKMEGTVSRHGPSGDWPRALDVRRFLRRGAKGVPTGEDSGELFNAVIVDTFGMGGSQRMFITTQTGRGGHVPDEVAESFMRCMLKRGYVVQKMDLDWTSWQQWLSFSTAQ